MVQKLSENEHLIDTAVPHSTTSNPQIGECDSGTMFGPLLSSTWNRVLFTWERLECYRPDETPDEATG
jgi:hypothetical protein